MIKKYGIKHNVDFTLKNLVPPKQLTTYHDDNLYLIMSFHNINKIAEHIDLFSNSKILDIGCSCGRLCLPFLKFLDDNGEYHGFDIDKNSIEWAKVNISSKKHNFFFKHIDLYNEFYNQNGIRFDQQLSLPYQNSYFDVIILQSVFTHISADEAFQFLKEIARILKKDAFCYFSIFLWNKESAIGTEEGTASHLFLEKMSNFCIERKWLATSIEESFICESLNQLGLKIEHLKYGEWRRQKDKAHAQDVVFVRKIV